MKGGVFVRTENPEASWMDVDVFGPQVKAQILEIEQSYADLIRDIRRHVDLSFEFAAYMNMLDSAPLVRPCIVVRDDTSRDDICTAWPLIAELRQRIIDRWGPEFDSKQGFIDWLLDSRFDAWEGKLSYQRIADSENSRLVMMLDCGLDDDDDFSRRMLKSYNLSDEDIDAWIEHGKANIAAGKPAFTKIESPITKEMVRERIRYSTKGGKTR